MLEFKKIGIDEIPAIQMVAYLTWPHTFGAVIPAAQLNYMLELFYSQSALEDLMLEKGHEFILIKKDGEPLGFTSFEFPYDGKSQLMIHKIYLLPAAQGAGIGIRTLDFLSRQAQDNNIEQLRLKVYFQNSKAIGFYEKYGFKKTGTETTNIGNDYIVLDNVMVKQL